MIKSWTEEQKKLMIKYYPVKSLPDMAKMLGKSKSIVKAAASRYKLKKKIFFFKKTWTKQQDSFLRKNYKKHTAIEIGKMMGKTRAAIQARLNVLGIKLPEKLKEQRAAIGRFKKGQVPANKGKKWEEFMSKEGQKNSRKTTFKKGQLPHNTRYNGAIRKRKNKDKKQYTYIRIGKGKWEMLHVHIYKKIHGRLPKNKIIVFKDNDQDNFHPSNLIALTRKQHIDRMRESDGYIATRMSMKDKALRNEILKRPELIDLKRTQLKLNKTINEKRRKVKKSGR